ncbi:MAG: Ig-like domain-containing protein, partial [Candidatus Sulfotelmatobacter sp.]
TYTTSKLTAKKHGMQAIYAGDSMFATSTGYLAQVVELYSTTTTITCSPNPSSFGQKLTITAVVKSSGPVTPTGRVTFRDGTTWIGAGTLSGGVATMSKSNLAAGTHPITATYDGDSNSAQSTSVVVNQVVN